MYVAAIDIGSNAMRLAIANTSCRPFHISYRSREPVRLGSSVFAQGVINEDIYSSLKQALLNFKNQLQNHNVHTLRAVATSAMREAKNQKDVVSRLKTDTGIAIEVISGEEEARLVSLAISKKLNTQQGHHLFIDIGGGSIELIASVDGRILKKQSFVIGMVRILELHKKQNQDLSSWLPAFIKNEIHEFFDGLPPLETAVGTGGNMDRFAKLKSFISNDENEFLTRKEMKKVENALEEVDYKERIIKFSLKPDRADVIIPAAIATNQIMKMARAEKIFCPQVGLKDGLLHELSSAASG